MDKHYSTEAPAEYAGLSIREIIEIIEEDEAEARMARAEREGRA